MNDGRWFLGLYHELGNGESNAGSQTNKSACERGPKAQRSYALKISNASPDRHGRNPTTKRDSLCGHHGCCRGSLGDTGGSEAEKVNQT